MARRRKLALSGLAVLALAAPLAAPARGQATLGRCPAAGERAQIEVLPFADHGNTCDGTNVIASYNSSSCRIPEVPYSGPEAIYKVRLNSDNQLLVFHLEMTAPADLVLALIKECDSEDHQCVNNSPDFIGQHAEEIAMPRADPGFYYLVIDNASDARCGPYTLTVTGVNPTPDLVLELAGPPDPVVAGENLTYTLTVSNRGALKATGVEITQVLPPALTFLPSEAGAGCALRAPGEVHCGVGDLPVGGSATRRILARVNPAARGRLDSMAEVKADQADSAPPDNRQAVKTTVIARSDLSIEKEAARKPHLEVAGCSLALNPDVFAVAGCRLEYTLRVHNAGPSDATQVTVTDTLPDKVCLLSGCATRTVTFPIIPRIAAGKSAPPVLLTVNVAPSAGDTLVNQARVTAPEGSNSAPLATEVRFETDLSITKTAITPTGLPEVAAGKELTYEITVHNDGPSDSTGATVTDMLPSHVTFVHPISPSACTKSVETVTCEVPSIPAGTAQRVSFVAHVDSSLRQTTIANTASVAAKEHDPEMSHNVSVPAETEVKVEADLRLVEKTASTISRLGLALADPTNPVVAGENLLYTIEVENEGPSDSRGGTISDTLEGLTFVSSPDGCRESESDHVVTCPVPALLVGQQPYPARFVVKTASGAKAPITNVASVKGEDDHNGTNDSSGRISTPVTQKADLAVAVTDSPDPVVLCGNLTYVLRVTNNGPSDAAGGKAVLKLPRGGSLAGSVCPATADVLAQCTFADLQAGATAPCTVDALAPSSRGPAKAIASVTDTTDPNQGNDTAEATTTVATAIDADLAVTQTAGVEAVVAGDLLRATFVVANRGPAGADAGGVNVEVALPTDVTLVSAEGGTCQPGGGVITCSLDTLDHGEERTLTLTVKVSPTFTGKRLSLTACIPTAGSDPYSGNNCSTVDTPVLHAAPLVLPFFDVAAGAGSTGATTVLAVKNPEASPVDGLDLDYFLEDGGKIPEPFSLPGRGILSRNLRGIESLRGHSGHVDITPADRSDPPPLHGDYFRIDPATRLASGALLVSTDTSRQPPELCRHWSVRFLNDKSRAAATELLFFVPGNQPDNEPIAVGKVYNEAGQLVQEISITEGREAFRKTTAETFDHGVELLANFGSIEWELRQGVAGNVAAVHRAEGKYAVSVPGFCRDGDRVAEPPSSPSSWILPYFEVDPDNPVGITTLLAVRNETDENVQVLYQYVSAAGVPLLPQPSPLPPLAGHGTRTVNLRDILAGPDRITGFVKITSTGGTLSGDFVRIDPQRRLAAGGALVDADPHRQPPQLCNSWDVRFLPGGPPANIATDFVFYVDNGTGDPVKGKVYGEGGTPEGDRTVSSPLAAFQVPAAGLQLPTGNGSVEWTFPDGVKGHVAARFTAQGGFSVLVPGVCRDPSPDSLRR